MKTVRFHFTNSTRESSAYRLDYGYNFYYYGELKPLEAMNNAIKDFLDTEDGIDILEYDDTVEYQRVLRNIPNSMLEKHGFFSTKLKIDETVELREWSFYEVGGRNAISLF